MNDDDDMNSNINIGLKTIFEKEISVFWRKKKFPMIIRKKK